MDGPRRSARLTSKLHRSVAAAIPAEVASQLVKSELLCLLRKRGLPVYKLDGRGGMKTKRELVDLLIEDNKIQAELYHTESPDYSHTLRHCTRIFSIIRYSGNGGDKSAKVKKRGDKLAKASATSLTNKFCSDKPKPTITLFTFVHWKSTNEILVTPRNRSQDGRSESQTDHQLDLALQELQPDESVCFVIQGYDGFCSKLSSWKNLQDKYPHNSIFLAIREQYRRLRGSLSSRAWLEVRKDWVGDSEDDLWAVFELCRLVGSRSCKTFSAATRHLRTGMNNDYKVRKNLQAIYAGRKLKSGRHAISACSLS